MSALTSQADTLPLASSTIRKLRLRIIPYIFLLYVIAYLDRVNVSYAQLNMGKSLGIAAAAFGLVSGIFFIGYFLFEIPSNAILYRVGARKWIARILISWGLVAMATGFVQNLNHLLIARFVLGLAEAGFFPGMVLYITLWFPAKEQARAFSQFMVAQVVAYIIGAPSGGWILDHVHVAGLDSWRWVFILQGLPAVIFGVVTFFYLTDRPRDARWLTDEERGWLEDQLARERAEKQSRHHLSEWQALLSPRILHLTAIYLCIVLGIYGLNFFLPQIVKGLSTSYSNTTVGLLAAIPFVIGGIAMLVNGWHSDKTLERKYHVMFCTVTAAAGLLLIPFFRHDPVLAIVLLCVVSIGNFGYIAAFWALPQLVLTEAAAATGIALINSVGNLGGFIGPYIVGAKATESNVTQGLYLLAASFLVATLLLVLLPTEKVRSAESLAPAPGPARG
ncbi:MAG: MFS transporter [Candidatus Dormibacter sp.]|uniref:MFS transporter n=1 Tax=Candidatus Dormibacter sp. TaxID=2973982 RepID=UPI000DB53801|nr:MAG: MFS transporter [Candidatus Dormibacteraeota bacterium]